MFRGESTLGSSEKTATSITTISSGRLSTSSQSSTPRLGVGLAVTIASASVNRASPFGQLLHRHREHDDAAEEDRLDARIDLQKVHRVGEDQQEERGER